MKRANPTGICNFNLDTCRFKLNIYKMNNNIELGIEESNIKEFLRKFSDIARIKYEELGLAGYIAVVSKDTDGMFQIVAQDVNGIHGRRGYGACLNDAIDRSLSTLTGVKSRDIVNVVPLNDSCVICSVSDDAKGYPERNDERDIQIMTSVLEEMSLE